MRPSSYPGRKPGGEAVHRPRLWALALAAALLLPWRGDAQAPLEVLLDFSEDERRTILQHGPWPPPPARDPSNRVSGNPEAIALGEKLFFDPRVSGKSTSCATCHAPEKGWADGRKVGMGMVEVDRNTPSVHNVGFQRWFGWDGANDNLWAQSVRPMLDAREMGSTERNVADLVRNDADLGCRYQKIFGAVPASDNDEGVVVNAGKALAAFQETLVTGRTPFDEFRDALARGDRAAAARYPQDAQKGLRIFAGKGNCSVCHFGPNFTHGEFHEIGIPVFKQAGGVDWGRYEGIKLVRATRFNLLGAYNDDPKGAPGTATRHVALIPQAFEQFKVPTLRNVALTAPYMHNGHLATLAEVVRHYSEIDPTLLHAAADGRPAEALLKPLRLSSIEISYLVAFLDTLTDMESRAPRKPIAACQ